MTVPRLVVLAAVVASIVVASFGAPAHAVRRTRAEREARVEAAIRIGLAHRAQRQQRAAARRDERERVTAARRELLTRILGAR